MTMSQKLSNHSESNVYSMLEVYEEKSVSPLTTESGGIKCRQDFNGNRQVSVQLTCSSCNRSFVRKDYHARHVRRCKWQENHNMKNSSVSSITHINTLTAKDSKLTNHIIGTTRNNSCNVETSRLFHCNKCAVTMNNLTKLREHKRIHLRRFYCDICGVDFTSINEFEFHCIVCAAKHEANTLLNITTQVAKATSLPVRRVTRAKSKVYCNVPTKPIYNQTDFSKEPRKQRRKKLKIDKPFYIKKNDTKYPESESTICFYYINNNYEDVNDEVSVVDTMYQRRLSLTGQWVEEHSNSQSITSIYDESYQDYPFDNDEQNQINSYKEHDLYLLDRLKAEIFLNSFTCFVPGCNYQTDTLPKMMLHDYIKHFKMSWFYCQKCGNCFTSKVFLDYHLDRQNSGRYVCYKCGDVFEYQHQLDRHIIRHNKCVNYHCNYCKYEFLTENELLEHCTIEQHDPNGERIIISIDHAMTISNPPIVEIPQTRSNSKHTIKILDMRLPHITSKRCMPIEKFANHLPLHLQRPYIRLRIGEIEFKNRRYPNCWGWT